MSEQLLELQAKIESAMGLLKIDDLKKKMAQLESEMSAPNFWTDQTTAQTVSQDFSDIKNEVEKWESLNVKVLELLEMLELSKTEAEKLEVEKEADKLTKEFENYELALLLDGPYDKNNAIIAMHAGSGGTEAQDWTEMLVRMVMRFCEKQNWKTEILDESRGAEAGYKSIMFKVTGRNAYGYLESEHGTHRLVRISPFDAEKMRHTSFALMEVLPEIDEKATVEIDPKDLRIDTFMSGGKGGQSVNTTYSAVRIVHLPTNITVSCQNERSQMQNRETAMKVLKSKLLKLEEEKKAKERNELRGEYKSAEWGNQIRSYVLHPYHLVKDHRTDYESTDPEGVLEGDMMPLCESYLKWIKL
jgi:peptide chain release factor 2